MRKILIASAAVMLALGSAGVGSAQDPRQLACDAVCRHSVEGAANCTATAPMPSCKVGIPFTDSLNGAHCCNATVFSFEGQGSQTCVMRYSESSSTARVLIPESEPGTSAKETTVSCEVEQKCTIGSRQVKLCRVTVLTVPDCKKGPKVTTGYVCKFTQC